MKLSLQDKIEIVRLYEKEIDFVAKRGLKKIIFKLQMIYQMLKQKQEKLTILALKDSI